MNITEKIDKYLNEKNDAESYLMGLKTNDYQNRYDTGKQVRPGVPDFINTWKMKNGSIMVNIVFLDTRKSGAESWTKSNIIPKLKKFKADYDMKVIDDNGEILVEIEVKN